MAGAQERREQLGALRERAQGCARCPQLAQARHTVVFGTGAADADVMLVGVAPGVNEDRDGQPFAGQAGGLLDRLLAGVGMAREDVFLTTVVKCRPPGNRDPLPAETDACRDYLLRQLELVQPKVVCALGNFATKLLRGDPTPVTRLHGVAEVRTIGPRTVRLLPLHHPAAALYTPAMQATLEADFTRVGELVALPAPAPPAVAGPPRPGPAVPDPEPEAPGAPAPEPEPAQLGLF